MGFGVYWWRYCLNNPLKYTDTDGELIGLAIIGAALYGMVNTITHYNNGDINNFGDGLSYFATGAVVGAIAGATWGIGIAGVQSASALAQIGGWTIMAGKGINIISTASSFIGNAEKAGKILMGKAYTDSGWRGLWQGITRNTWKGFNHGLDIIIPNSEMQLAMLIGWII